MVSNSSTSTSQVEQVGHREEHRLLHRGGGVGLDQQVHRPIRLIVGQRVQPGDRHVQGGPLGRGQLRARVQGPVGDQREQDPLHVGGEPPRSQQRAQRGVDAQLVPQPVEQPHPTQRPGRGHPQQIHVAGDRMRAGVRVGVAQVAGDATTPAGAARQCRAGPRGPG